MAKLTFGFFLTVILSLPSAFSAEGNTIQVLNHAVASFQKRLEMIDRAQTSIDIEYFIYNMDEAGRIFTQALVRKKLQNPEVKIRIIVDSSGTVLDLKKHTISELAKHGIEVKYYNDISLLLHFKKAQFRDHRKLLAIDGKEAITGSRNIADEYFDLSPTYNFRDRDIWIKGPVAKEMTDSFDVYWAHELTTDGPLLGEIDSSKKEELQKSAQDFLVENDHDRHLRKEIERVGAPILANPESIGECQTLTHVTDDAGFQTEETRQVFPVLMDRLSRMSQEEKLYVESPYFIVRDQSARDQMLSLKERNVSAVLLTNSLASTDAFYVAANFYPRSSFYQSISNSKMYVFDGKTPANLETVLLEDGSVLTKDSTWGIHAKTFVFSDSDFAIGTFNVDPRSANLNSETMVFCAGNAKLTKFVRDDIETRMGQADLIDRNGKLPNGKTIFDGVGFKKKLMYKLSRYPAAWFSYLL